MEVPSDQRPAPRGAVLLQATMMGAPNDARSAVGVALLIWTKRWSRRRGPMRRNSYGCAVSRMRSSRTTNPRGRELEMIGHWVAERRDFVDAPVPGFSRTGTPGDVAYKMQIIW